MKRIENGALLFSMTGSSRDTRKTVSLGLNQSLQQSLEAFSKDFFRLSIELLPNVVT